MRIFVFLGLAVLVGESIAAKKRSSRGDTCGCKDGTCTVSFQLPKRTRVVNNCPSSERMERQVAHLQAMVYALHDEMVALATTVQQQQVTINGLSGRDNKQEEVTRGPVLRERNRWQARVEQDGLVCPMDFEKVGAMCYLVMEEMFNWTYAGQLCKEQSASLVAIESQQQQQQLVALLRKFFIEEKVWIGANSLRNPASFVWNNNSQPGQYYNWAPGMPVIKDQLRCAYMSPDQGWQWKVGPCDKHFYFICSKTPTRD